jgi:hypothetical protein
VARISKGKDRVNRKEMLLSQYEHYGLLCEHYELQKKMLENSIMRFSKKRDEYAEKFKRLEEEEKKKKVETNPSS